MKTKEEILEETMCCTITEEADLDDPKNFYFKYDDVLKAMEEYAQQFSAPEQLLPIIEKVFGPGAVKGCAERKRQIEVEGWTPEHDDDCNKCNQLALAAALYLLPKAWREDIFIFVSIYWPWDVKWWKPTPDNRIRELEKGIALGMAEIDRLKRKEEGK